MAKETNTEKWKYYVGLAIIVLLSFFAYLPVLHNGLLLWDDEGYIKNNPLAFSINLKEIFSQYVMGNYHPLTMLTFAIEYQLFGLNETGYHMVNLLLHLMIVILVFYAILLLSDKPGVALVASLLFGIHPMHVESVAWAAELKDLLYTFFFLASYILYLKYLKDRNRKFYVLALLLFLVSLLSKAMAASLPAVLILTDYFKGRKMNKTSLLDKIPFFLLAFAFGIVAVLAQKSTAATDIVNLTFPQRIIFACYGFISYLFKLLFPLHMSAYYPYPIRNGENVPLQYFTYLILFIGFIAVVLYSLRFTKKIFFGIGFFVITVFLVLQLYPVGGAVMADRYSYVPSIGIFYLAGEGFILLWNKKLKFVNIILLTAFTIFFSVKTYARCGVWKNDMIFWNDVISKYQNIPFAYVNRGIAFISEEKYDRGLNDFNKAIELNPNYYLAYYNRGNLFMSEKKYDRALEDYGKVIKLNPNHIEAYINRGIAFRDINRFDEALNDYNKAIELKPNYYKAYYNRGNLLMSDKKYDRALDDYNKAIKLNPNYFKPYNNRGNLYFNEKKYDEAIINYSKAIELNADFTEAYYNRGIAKYYFAGKDSAYLDIKRAANSGYQPAAEALFQIFNEKTILPKNSF